jgi:thiosulfate/3-mercaptopyruvate sulfurtransferase
MNYAQIKFIPLTFLLFYCIACSPEIKEQSPPPSNLLANTKEVNTLDRQVINHHQLLAWQRDSPSVILIDARPDETFKEGHLKGAVQIWRPDIQSNLFPYKGMMLEKQQLELVLGELGATSKSIFVVYDNNGSTDAARLWWILTTYGHSKVYILDGGLRSAPKGLMNREITTPKATKFQFPDAEHLDLKVNKEDVLAAITDSNTILLDCRTSDEFTGKTIKKNAFRGGHIPTAIHLNYNQSIAYHNALKFKPYQELMQIFQVIPKDKRIIVYCQSGVRSAHATFVLHKLLGFPNVANYDGSWIEWSHDKALPIVTGL